jgi:hypothetical protein
MHVRRSRTEPAGAGGIRGRRRGMRPNDSANVRQLRQMVCRTAPTASAAPSGNRQMLLRKPAGGRVAVRGPHRGVRRDRPARDSLPHDEPHAPFFAKARASRLVARRTAVSDPARPASTCSLTRRSPRLGELTGEARRRFGCRASPAGLRPDARTSAGPCDWLLDRL